MRRGGATAWMAGVLLVLATGTSGLAQDDSQQDWDKLNKELQRLLDAQEKYRETLDEIRTEFERYKAAKDAEVARLTLDLENQRARLELARRRTHEIQDEMAALAEEVKRANAINAENRAWLEKNAGPESRKRTATDYLVRLCLPNAIENYRARFHRVPPMSVKELNVTSRYQGLRIETNTVNECSEALVVALRDPDFPAPLRERFLPTRPPFGNTDADSWNAVPDGGVLEAVELLDAWGHPIVYIHKNHYKEAVRVVNAKGVEVQVVALFGPNGVYYNPTSYQIFSLGPNGVQEVETKKLQDSDDLRNFELKDK